MYYLVTAPSNWFQMPMISLWNIKYVVKNDALSHFFRDLEILEFSSESIDMPTTQFKKYFLQELSFITIRY